MFKQITKVDRRSVEGVVNKKDGKWYVLADTGSYRLNDKAVEFHNLQLNDKITVLIPEDNLNTPYAALDKVPDAVKKVEVPTQKDEVKEKIVEKPIKKPEAIKPVEKKPFRPKPKPVSKPEKPKADREAKPKEQKVESRQEGVTQILSDDDLR